MILYQLVKWMEERIWLQKLIAETKGDNRLLMHQKSQLERRMLRQTQHWFDPVRFDDERQESAVSKTETVFSGFTPEMYATAETDPEHAFL